eukprot:TRINITY_DN8343_c0_g1_i1.p1 TRINITY_DN8343_c0_g1~~TRINITY_DN8343_c0_g1_i1.p1  ORF type:complete len:392 (-),score=93.45 TRINITY_DN8343_c0_g1_i1:93-1268(-)
MGNTAASAVLGECQGALPAVLFEEADFEDTYEVDEEQCLGRGKFGEVYLCWLRNDPSSRYALKAIDTRRSDGMSLDRIRDEISILQAIGSHRRLVSCVDVDESLPGTIRLVMELCDGGELYDRIQTKKRYQEHEAKIVCMQLLEALSFVHGKGIMHRDIKPENILLCSRHSDTDVRISDFGLAKMSRNFPERLPRSNSICGSDFYLAPEIIRQEEYGREVDIWALGVVTFVLLSGSLPFYHEVLHKLYRQIVEREMTFQQEAWKGVSKGAMDFILRMLQIRVGERPSAEQGQRHPWLRMTLPQGISFSAVDEVRAAAQLRSGASQGALQTALAPSDFLRHNRANGQAPANASASQGAAWPVKPDSVGSFGKPPGSVAMPPAGVGRGRFAGA